MKSIISYILLGFFLFSCGTKDDTSKEPKFSTSDIELFWKVFDENSQEFNQEYFEENYVNKGSIGLKDFNEVKNICPELEKKLNNEAYLKYYKSIRENTSHLDDVINTAKEGYNKLEDIYSGFNSTDIYFLIGALTAGGKKSENGLMIAVEFFAKTDTTSLIDLNLWYQDVIREKHYIPSIVIHELVHFQQSFYPKNIEYNTLLEQTIMEGMADYIACQILNDEPFFNDHLHKYADTIEQELWLDFKEEMDLNYKVTSDWLYNGGRNTGEIPADLGYYVGFKILEAYAAGFNNNSDAIEAMLSNADYYDILEKSNYESKFK